MADTLKDLEAIYEFINSEVTNADMKFNCREILFNAINVNNDNKNW